MVESKVKASSYAASVTAVVMYFLGQIPLVAGMPEPVKVALAAAVFAAATFAAGYAADHTPRPDLERQPRHAADSGYSAPELAMAVGIFIVLIALAVFLLRGA